MLGLHQEIKGSSQRIHNVKWRELRKASEQSPSFTLGPGNLDDKGDRKQYLGALMARGYIIDF